ncbi:Uncharacterized protein Adt_34417 [Abeliophyllum distichum]|uniref:PWWP domain-containing protein n=1 Tax=Abeliophyllum distichum TaxID=126358 RepID=A0ABD1R1F5_9LAMI
MSEKLELNFHASRVEQDEAGGGAEYKTLMENSRDPGGKCSVDGVMVLEECKGFVGGTQMQDVNRVMDVKEGGDGKMDDKVSEVSVELNVDENVERVWGAYRKTRIEERTTGKDARGSLGVMELVGRVLDGNFRMEKEKRDFKHFGDKNSSNLLVDLNVTRDGIGDAVSGNEFGNKGTGVDKILDGQKLDFHGEGAGLSGEAVSGNEISSKGTGVDKVLDEQNFDLHGEGTGLNGKNVVINEQVPDGNSRNAEEYCDRPGFLVPKTRGEGAGLNVKQNVVINEQVPDVNSGNAEGDNEKPGLLIPKTCGEGAGLNGKENMVVNEHASDVNFRNAEGYNGKPGWLIPKTRGEECITEKEGEFCVSDLVWGKVRSHPWWPGQVFEPSAASENAIKYFKRDSYLLAYFGDQTFAWNEAAKIKPFQMHFSQMEKQSNSVAFCHAVDCALDETARRVEFGLSCSCLLEEVDNNIKTQVVANAGIREESSRRDDRDNLSSAAAFLPAELVRVTISFLISKSLGGLLEDDSHVTVLGEGRDSPEVMEGALPGSKVSHQSKRRRSIPQDGSSRKRRHLSGDDGWPNEKEKCTSDLMSSSSSRLQNGEKKSGRKASKKMGTSGEKREPIDSLSIDSNVEGRKSLLPPNEKVFSQPNSYLRVGERVCRALKSGDGSSTQSYLYKWWRTSNWFSFGFDPWFWEIAKQEIDSS